MNIVQMLQNEVAKTKHTVIWKVLLILPIILSCATLFMIRTAGAGDPAIVFKAGVSTWFTLLAMVTPLLLSLFAGVMGEQEFDAGNFQVMRNSKSSEMHFVMKNIYLLSVFFVFSLIAMLLVVMGIKVVYKPIEIDILHVFKTLLIFVAGSLFFVPFNLYIGFTFGLGSSMSLGIFGSFFVTYLSSIPLLSERIWRFIPWAWSHKLSTAYYDFNNSIYNGVNVSLDLSIQLIAFAVTLLLIAFWFGKWEGRE